MKRLISSALLTSLVMAQTMNATEVLPALEISHNPTQLLEQILCPSGTFDVEEARHLMFQLKRDVKVQYGIDLNFEEIINESLKLMQETGNFTQEEIDTAQVFYLKLTAPKEMVVSRFRKHKYKHNDAQEFMLPDKMSVGFVCIFSGALLCILPFGITQSIGTGLIGTGIYSIIDGVREGEKPYYIDSETGRPLSGNSQNTGPSIGIGTGF